MSVSVPEPAARRYPFPDGPVTNDPILFRRTGIVIHEHDN